MSLQGVINNGMARTTITKTQGEEVRLSEQNMKQKERVESGKSWCRKEKLQTMRICS